MIIKPSERIGEVKAYYFATKLAEIAEMNARGEDVLNLGIGSPDLLPPPQVLEKLRSASKGDRANRYQSYKGLPILREAFAHHYKKMMDVDIDPSKEVLPLIGSKEGIMHISMSFLNKGDKVLVPNPGYPSYRVTTELAGAIPIFYDLTEDSDWLPDIERLEQSDLSKVKIMWMNYPNMPTGATLDHGTLKSLVAFAKKHEILLCHDNPYNFILNDEPRSIFNIDGAKECCLELCSLSKCFNMSGWRVGALLGDEKYVDVVMRFKSNMDSGMYRPIQEAAAVALQLDNKWFSSLNSIYKERRKVVHEIFELLDCDYNPNSAGLFVWAKAPSYIQDVTAWADDILQEAKVFITPGFIFGSNGEKYVRIALCTDISGLNEAKHRIESRFVKAIV